MINTKVILKLVSQNPGLLMAYIGSPETLTSSIKMKIYLKWVSRALVTWTREILMVTSSATFLSLPMKIYNNIN